MPKKKTTQPTKSPVVELDKAKKQALAIRKQATPFDTWLERKKVTKEEGYDDACRTLDAVVDLRKQAEARFAAYKKPLNALKALMGQDFNPVISALKKVENHIKYELVQPVIRSEQKKLRVKEERKAKRAEKKGDAERAEDIREAASGVSTIPKEVKVGSMKQSANWVAEITDKRELLQSALKHEKLFDALEFDQPALNKLAREVRGDSPFPGLKIVNKPKMSW